MWLKEFVLRPEDSRIWKHAIANIPPPSEENSWIDFIAEAKAIAKKYLPACLQKAIAVSLVKKDWDAILIKNVPIDTHIPSPLMDGLHSRKKTWVSEGALVGVAELAGATYSFSEEMGGRLIHDIIPLTKDKTTINLLSRGELKYHVESEILAHCNIDFVPERIALIGLRNDNCTVTKLLHCENVLSHLSSHQQLMLSNNLFVVDLPDILKPAQRSLPPIKLLHRDEKKSPLMTMSSGGAHGVTVEAEKVVRELEKAVAKAASFESIPIVIGSGNLLIWNQLRILHARSPIVGERWLQRAYISRDLEPFKRATSTEYKRRTFDLVSLFWGSLDARPKE